MNEKTPFLFAVDVEDPRSTLADGSSFPARVPAMVERYLAFLDRCQGRGTFFVVGEVAREHPSLIRRILDCGHEIACHSDSHIPIDKQSRAEFREDLQRNLDALTTVGGSDVQGYRAPCFSLTEQSPWVYEVLAELGFRYSSSVLPSRNPLYGWPTFGTEPRLIDDIVELPVSLLRFPLLSVPVGGIYFRVLPRIVVARALRHHRKLRRPVLGYFHPYDLDTEQAHGHGQFRSGGVYDLLIRAKKSEVLPRLEMAHAIGFDFQSYSGYAARMRQTLIEGKPG